MAQYGSNASAIKVGANFVEQYITGNIEVDKTAETEDGTPIGANVAKQLFTGLTTLGDITVEGPYDDTPTTGPDAIFGGGLGTSQTVIVGYAGGQTQTKKTTVTLGIKNYKRIINKGSITGYSCTLVNTGTTIVEA